VFQGGYLDNLAVSHGIYTRSKCQTKNRLQGPQEDIKILHGRGFIRANCTLNIDPCEEVGIDVQETEGPYQILIEKVFLSGIH